MSDSGHASERGSTERISPGTKLYRRLTVPPEPWVLCVSAIRVTILCAGVPRGTHMDAPMAWTCADIAAAPQDDRQRHPLFPQFRASRYR